MASRADDQRRLSKDARLIPPDRFAAALLEAETEAKGSGRWNETQTTHVFLRAWAALIDDIGHYRPYGSDDYHHHLSYRIMLHRLLEALRNLDHVEALDWLQREVDLLDQFFLERSTYDRESLILRPEKSNPSYWFMRRLPSDENVVEHLRMIQPGQTEA